MIIKFGSSQPELRFEKKIKNKIRKIPKKNTNNGALFCKVEGSQPTDSLRKDSVFQVFFYVFREFIWSTWKG